jgi:hypothetical protein
MPEARVLLFGLSIGLGAQTITSQAPLRQGYETIGEGLTAATRGGAIEFGWRLFTIYTMEDACRRSRAERTARLRTDETRVSARLGERFLPAHLKIWAQDASGGVLPQVPIAVELNAPPDFFDVHLPDAPDGPPAPLGSGPLVARQIGTATFRARTICPGSTADVLLEFRASH